MRQNLVKYLVLFTLIASNLSAVWAQKDSITSDSSKYAKDKVNLKVIDPYSLEDLLNMRVMVASKKEEKVSEAPGSVTTYSEKDIEKTGYYTLSDLANITVGYSAFSAIGEKTFETRGQKADGFDNNKHLILIDGIPFSHTRANRANSEEDLPLLFARRVEFLKGPGSSLYGISAFYGVMNILSKELSENGTMIESKFSVGNYDFKRRAMFNVVHRTDAGQTKISASYFGKDATEQYLGTGTNINNLSRYNDNVTSIFMNVSHQLMNGLAKGLRVGFMYNRKTGGLGDFWMNQQNQTYGFNELTWEQIVPYLKYERKFGNRITLNSYFKGNMSSEKAYTGGYQNTFNGGNAGQLGVSLYNVRVIDKEFFGELRYNLAKSINLIGGINIVSRYSTGAPQTYAYFVTNGPGLTFDPDPSYYSSSGTFNFYSAFLQIQQNIKILKGMTITAGARMDQGRVHESKDFKKLNNSYDQLSPRIAIVQRFTNKINLKLMYGSALRAPLIKEVGINEETKVQLISAGRPDLVANIPNLKSETIRTIESGLYYSTKIFTVMATVFYNETYNSLGKAPLQGDPSRNIQVNQGGIISAKGIETELVVMPVKNIKLGSNFTTSRAVDVFNIPSANVPTAKLNVLATYSVFNPINLSVTAIGKWIENFTSVHNNNIERYPGFHVMDMNIMGEVTKNMGLELQIRNILGAEIRTPAFFTKGYLNVPYPGRSYLVTASYKF